MSGKYGALTQPDPHPWVSDVLLCLPKIALAVAVALAPTILVVSSAHAQTFNILYAFKRTGDGGSPQAGLVRSPEGGLYGTTFLGGDASCSCGTVFKLFPNGAFTVLYRFKGRDGANPSGALTIDGSGNLYGTTYQGGVSQPHGTAFKLAPPVQHGGAWTETVLHTFTGGADGANPSSGLIRDRAGNLYGTTYGGGAFGNGTVFKLDATGKKTVLYNCAKSPDGAHPYAGLVQDTAGNLYGTTLLGGAFNHGTVFELDTTGKETVLYSFSGNADGAYPNAALILDGAGNLYGTANQGGNSTDNGTVFMLDTARTLTVLHAFGGGTDGSSPDSGLIMDGSGNLYGTTTEGGDADNDGTVFKIDNTGVYTLIHTFTAGHGGAYPYGGLVRDPAGNLYGTAVDVGDHGNGIAFQITGVR